MLNSINSFMTEILSYRNESTDLRINQWTGFFMTRASAMKELRPSKNTEKVFKKSS